MADTVTVTPPAGAGNTTPLGGGHSGDDDLKFLENLHTDETAGVKSVKVESPEDEEVEEPEVELEAEEPEADVDLEETPEEIAARESEDNELKGLDRTSIRDLRAAFPDIFKKFPELKEAIFREQALTREFPTVRDAQFAKSRVETLDSIEADIAQGNVVPLLTSIKEMSSKDLEKVAFNFLPALEKVDKATFLEVMKPMIKRLARGMYNTGLAQKDENLQNSAIIVNQFVFNDQNLDKDYTHPALSTEPDELSKREQEFNNRLLTQAGQDVQARAEKRLQERIGQSLGGLKLTPYLQNTIIKEIMNRVFNTLAEDANHQKTMTQVWKDVQRSGYTEEAKVRALTTFLTRVSPIITTIRREEVEKALGNKIVDPNQRPTIKRVVPSGGAPRGSSVNKGRVIDWSKTNDADYVAGKITYKK